MHASMFHHKTGSHVGCAALKQLHVCILMPLQDKNICHKGIEVVLVTEQCSAVKCVYVRGWMKSIAQLYLFGKGKPYHTCISDTSPKLPFKDSRLCVFMYLAKPM